MDTQYHANILKYKISLFNYDDISSWIHTRAGLYIVRSGHQFLQQFQEQNRGHEKAKTNGVLTSQRKPDKFYTCIYGK